MKSSNEILYKIAESGMCALLHIQDSDSASSTDHEKNPQSICKHTHAPKVDVLDIEDTAQV